QKPCEKSGLVDRLRRLITAAEALMRIDFLIRCRQSRYDGTSACHNGFRLSKVRTLSMALPMLLETRFFEDRLCVGRDEVLQKLLGGRRVAGTGGNESNDPGWRINIPRQNPDDREFVFFRKNIAEEEHTDIDVAAGEPLLRRTHGSWAFTAGRIKT